MPTHTELIEPVIIPDTFVSGLSHVEHVGGGCLRFVLYVDRIIDGVACRMIVDRIIMHADALPDAISKALAACTADNAAENAERLISTH